MSQQLHARLDDRIRLLEALEGISSRQAEAIEARETDELIRLLARRERLTEDLLAGAGPLEEAAQAWKASGAEQDGALQGKIARAEALLKGIVDQDAADEAAIRETRGDIGEELTGLGRGSAARRAYVGGRRPGVVGRPEESTFTDSTG